MTKTIVVGDLHGRIEIALKASQLLHEGYNLCFMGDYLDSFDRSVDDQVNTLLHVLHLVDKYPDRVVALKANHEMSYLSGKTCSGWKSETQCLVDAIGRYRIDTTLVSYTFIEGFLISHAGVSLKALKAIPISLGEYLSVGEEGGLFDKVGGARGGYGCGGLYWCDWFEEFEPLKEQPQIVGHSGYRPEGVPKGVLQKGNSYNVDCFEHCNEVLILEDGCATVQDIYIAYEGV